MSYSVPLNLVVVLSFIVFVFYLLGIHNVLTNLGENECEMTYMFEFPQFVEISMPAGVGQAFPRYALFGYAEGGHTEKLRQMRFNGIPVLFLPGSSGSYKQGRSLASVSLRKALNSRMPFYFDYFMVDFNEDQSGIYGGTLEDQTKFVRHCITKILSFYTRNPGNLSTSVILIGHSLGGLIAKSVFNDPEFKKDSVHLIISLASPHKYPVLQSDTYIANFHKNIKMHWKNNTRVSHVNLVSIGGGFRDFVVRSDLTHDSQGDINVLTTAIPGVWCSTDHLSILWCKQLVLTLVRAMFDCIDINTKQLIKDKESRISILKYHLLKRSAGKRFATSQHMRFATFDKEAYWYENMLRQFSVIEHKGVRNNNYIMIRLHQDPKHAVAFIETFNLNTKDWLYVCSADLIYKSVRVCETGENLSNLTEIAPVAPSTKLKRKFAYVNLLKLKAKNFSHVIVRVPRMDSYVQVNVDVHGENDRVMQYSVPSIYSMYKGTIIQQTDDNSVYYRINLIGFDSIWQAFNLEVQVISCKTAKNNAVLSFITPWASHHKHFFMTDRKSVSPTLTLITSRPIHSNETRHPYITMNLDPTCKYKVTIKPSVIASASQIVIYFTGALPAYIVTVLLLTIRQQGIHLEEGQSVFFHSALCSAVRRYYLILQATILGSKVLGLAIFHRFLPIPDFFTVEDLNMDFFFMSIILYGIAIVVTYSGGIACYVAIVVSGKTAHKMALRFITKTITGLVNWSEWIFTVFHQMPVLVSALLISLTVSTSGALSLCLGTIFYFLKICNMYEEYLEGIFQCSIKLIAEKVKNVTKRKPKDNTSEESNNEKVQEANAEQFQETSEDAAPNTSSDVSHVGESDSSDESDKSLELAENANESVGQLSTIHFHVALFSLWFTLTLLYLPSLLVWARNYQYKVFLENDPAVIPGIIVNVCGIVLWQSGVPYSCRCTSRFVSAILFILAAISIVYASVSVYRLGYIISAAMIVLTTNQLVAKFSS